MLCNDSLYWKGLNIECSTCTDIEKMECGAECDVKISWMAESQLMKFMGRVSAGWFRFIVASGNSETFHQKEIQFIKRIR